MTDPKNKIFCIGWHRTGTTSIGDALERLGFSRLGWDVNICSRLLFRWHEQNPVLRKSISEAVAEYDAFEDFPWPLLFRELDEMYPGARFILTTRKDTQTWLRSAQAHMAQMSAPWVGHYLIYGSYDPVGDAHVHMQAYERHNAAVRAHFSGAKSAQLLELCFETGDGWEELCGFLGVPKREETFPHANSSDTPAPVAAEQP